MSEAEQQRPESPLQTERGTTTIRDTVVSQIAGMAAQEVDGVHMGGSSRSGGGLFGGGSSNNTTRGVSVEVGSVEAAIDLTMGIEYGKNVLETVEEVRRRITENVGRMTGLRISELNATVNDIVFTETGGDGAESEAVGSGAGSSSSGPRTAMPSAELRPGAGERETTPVEPRSRSYTEGTSGPVPEEPVRAEGRPVDEDETAEIRPGFETRTRRPEGSPGETGPSESTSSAGSTSSGGSTGSSESTGGASGSSSSAGDTGGVTGGETRPAPEEGDSTQRDRRRERRERRERRGEDS